MKVLGVLPISILLAIVGAAQQPGKTGDDRAPSSDTAGKSGPSVRTMGNLEVLSDTKGVDFGPYLSKVLQTVRKNWYSLIPDEARAPQMKSGKLAIEFAIKPDGNVAGMKITSSSGEVALDRAAWGGITASVPFSPLPTQFTGPYLALRFRFYYNPEKGSLPH
jgi:TonB family protein